METAALVEWNVDSPEGNVDSQEGNVALVEGNGDFQEGNVVVTGRRGVRGGGGGSLEGGEGEAGVEFVVRESLKEEVAATRGILNRGTCILNLCGSFQFTTHFLWFFDLPLTYLSASHPLLYIHTNMFTLPSLSPSLSLSVSLS